MKSEANATRVNHELLNKGKEQGSRSGETDEKLRHQ